MSFKSKYKSTINIRTYKIYYTLVCNIYYTQRRITLETSYISEYCLHNVRCLEVSTV